MKLNRDLWKYIDNREAELLGGLVANDDSGVSVTNLVSDLAHAEAELLLVAPSNKNAKKYVKKSIINGNGAYIEWNCHQKRALMK